MSDFRAALARIPRDVPRVHHGRDPADGLDCCGLVYALYREAGVDLSDIDVPYASADARLRDKYRVLVGQLAKRFRAVPVNMELQDGDVVVCRVAPGIDNHLGVVVGQQVAMMTDRLTLISRGRALPWARVAYRLK